MCDSSPFGNDLSFVKNAVGSSLRYVGSKKSVRKSSEPKLNSGTLSGIAWDSGGLLS